MSLQEARASGVGVHSSAGRLEGGGFQMEGGQLRPAMSVSSCDTPTNRGRGERVNVA